MKQKSKSKFMWVALILLALNVFSLSAQAGPQGKIIYGDVTNDEKVDIIDALIIAQFYVGIPISGTFVREAADVNFDNYIDIIDALIIAQYYVQIIPELPLPPYKPQPNDYDCIIYIENNTIDINNSAIKLVEPQVNNQALVKLNLHPSQYAKARFEVHYKTEPIGYTLNIGDSETNNAGGGDGYTQARDAEVDITDGNFMIFRNDYGRPNNGYLDRLENVVSAEDTVIIEVADGYTKIEYPQGSQEYVNEYLYALNGQEDFEGPVNYDIFAAFNRVIDGTYRNGTGVDYVVITLM